MGSVDVEPAFEEGLIGYRITRRKNGSGVYVERLKEGGEPEGIELRLDIRSHSPTGFEVGYGGSGPAQTALAILADLFGERIAREHYQDFKWEVVSKIDLGGGESFELREEDFRDFF